MKDDEQNMTGKDWSYVAENSDLPEGNMMAVYPLGIHILLARVEGSVYALTGLYVSFRTMFIELI